MRKKGISFLIAVLGICLVPPAQAGGGHEAAPWGYGGDRGPTSWGQLKDEFSVCSQGKNQSPIDITGSLASSIEPIDIHYQPTHLNVLNNGHTIQVNYDPGSYIMVEGKKFNLLQFHFHSPSEHTVNGKHYLMEMHLVHKSKDGELAVIGVLMRTGKTNSALQKIWDNLPAHINKEKKTAVALNVLDLMPPVDRAFHRYNGSLTTPPCSEGIMWSIFPAEMEVSQSQADKFLSLIKANNRPVQPLHARKVLLKH